MYFNREGAISTLNSRSADISILFHKLGRSVSSTEYDVNISQLKAWTAIDKLSIIWKSDVSDKIKRYVFQAVVVSVLLNVWTIWMLTKRIEKKLDCNSTRILQIILKPIPQETTASYLLSLKPSKTNQIRGHCWKARMNSKVMFFYGPLHMNVSVLADQQERTNNFVLTLEAL